MTGTLSTEKDWPTWLQAILSPSWISRGLERSDHAQCLEERRMHPVPRWTWPPAESNCVGNSITFLQLWDRWYQEPYSINHVVTKQDPPTAAIGKSPSLYQGKTLFPYTFLYCGMSLQGCVDRPQPVLFAYSEREVEEAVSRPTGWTREHHSKVYQKTLAPVQSAVIISYPYMKGMKRFNVNWCVYFSPSLIVFSASDGTRLWLMVCLDTLWMRSSPDCYQGDTGLLLRGTPNDSVIVGNQLRWRVSPNPSILSCSTSTKWRKVKYVALLMYTDYMAAALF